MINVKRTDGVYREEGLMVRKRRRTKLPVPERQPLVRRMQPNEMWSMDFVFDEMASGRREKTLTVVDDCSKEAVQIAVDTSIPALYVTRVLDQVKAERGLPKVIRTDNGPEFAGRTMQAWAATNGIELRFIQPGKPVQNAYIESFNSRFRDKCLSQHWFASLNTCAASSTAGVTTTTTTDRTAPSGYVPPALFASTSKSKCYERRGQRSVASFAYVKRYLLEADSARLSISVVERSQYPIAGTECRCALSVSANLCRGDLRSTPEQRSPTMSLHAVRP